MTRKYVVLAVIVAVAIVAILFAALQFNGMKEQDKGQPEETQVEQNKADKAAKTFYVKDYGAIADDGQDDRAAIEAAIRMQWLREREPKCCSRRANTGSPRPTAKWEHGCSATRMSQA
jgi:hypothetical protein